MSAARVGRAAALLCTALSLAYVAAQLAEWLGWLGSDGGPESSSTPVGLALLLTPSLLLGPSFLVLMASLHASTPAERRVWTQIALAFATAYATLIGLVYFVQLTLVAPRLAEGRVAGIEPFLFVPFDSFLYAVDLLGYGFMSLSTLFAARALDGAGPERAARRWLTANGLLLPFLVGQMFVQPLIWLAAAWAVTFPASTLALAGCFRQGPARSSQP